MCKEKSNLSLQRAGGNISFYRRHSIRIAGNGKNYPAKPASMVATVN